MTVGADNFADAPVIDYNGVSDPTPSGVLTTEVGEPGLGTRLNRTAWWKFTAPATELVGIDTMLTPVLSVTNPGWSDTYINVYTGTTLDTLYLVAEGDDHNRMPDPDSGYSVYGNLTEMDMDAQAGTTYYVQVCSFDSAQAMDYVLRLGKRTYATSTWQQPDDVTTLTYWHEVSAITGVTTTHGAQVQTSTTFGAAGPAYEEAEVAMRAMMQAARDAIAVTNAFPSSSTHNLRGGVSYPGGIDPTKPTTGSADAMRNLWMAEIEEPVVNDYEIPFQPEAMVEYGDPPTVVQAILQGFSLYYSAEVNGGVGIPQTIYPAVSIAVDVLVYIGIPNYDNPLTWDLRSHWTAGSYNLTTTDPPGEGVEHCEVSIDITAAVDNNGPPGVGPRFVIGANITDYQPYDLVWPAFSYDVNAGLLWYTAGGQPETKYVTLTMRPTPYRYVYPLIGAGFGVLKVMVDPAGLTEVDRWQSWGFTNETPGAGKILATDGWHVADDDAATTSGQLKIMNQVGEWQHVSWMSPN